MTPPKTPTFSKGGFFTAFAMHDRIEVLCRSSDWYKVPPIQRYLYNMAASQIRMEDAKTETRVYTYDRYESMRLLIQRCTGQEWEVAWEAWMLWGTRDLEFGVVHLDQRAGHSGNLLIGDDPFDVGEFAPDDGTIITDSVRRVSHLMRPEVND